MAQNLDHRIKRIEERAQTRVSEDYVFEMQTIMRRLLSDTTQEGDMERIPELLALMKAESEGMRTG